MPMITCPECSASVSDQANTCPQCGHPIATTKASPSFGAQNSQMRMMGFGLGGLVLIGLLGTVYIMQPKQQEPAAGTHQAAASAPASNQTASQASAPPASAAGTAPASAPADAASTGEQGKYSGDIQAIQTALPSLQTAMCNNPCKFDEVRIIGNHVWYQRTVESEFETGIGVREGNTWKKLKSIPKHMQPDDAIAAGVPKDIAEFLVPVAETSGMVNAILNNEDINSFSEWELMVMRNTIYAQHGRKFTTPRLQQYFESWPWYKPNPNFSESELTDIEKDNIKAIQAVEKKKGYL